ncbi:hypothetical protein EYF80_028872 [Liparis tanakae]|uniref:Uncharacterized protein n=1 Tax=Liparis tanakae TaxID=230148 RepID=A0A4Z2H4U2_9TELE|nr:hypothetical protein EYF80_028872 [Liparis tanakae]
MLQDSRCSELSIDRVSLLCGATASEAALGPPLPIELEVLLLLWRNTNTQLRTGSAALGRLVPVMVEEEVEEEEVEVVGALVLTGTETG